MNLVIDLHAKRVLKRLSSCYAVTQRAILERILVEVKRATLDGIARVPNGHADYYASRLRLNLDGVTLTG